MQQKRILPVLFVTLLLDMIGIGMLIPIIPALFTDSTSPSFLLQDYSVSARYIVAGLLTALFGFMQFLAAPIIGELSDMYGRKKLLTIGVATLAVSQLFFATGIAVHSLFILFSARAIAGIAGANFSVAQAMIADVTPPENRARNFGLIGAAFGIGFILGPLLGGTLAAVSGDPALPFIFAGILGIMNVMLVTFFLRETHHVQKEKTRITPLRALNNIKSAFNDHDTRPVYFAGFFATLGFAFFTSFIAIFLSESFKFSEAHIGTYFALVGIWVVFAQIVVVRIMTKHYSDRNRLLVALPILAFVIGIQPFIIEEAYLYVFMPFMACSFAMVSTGIPALVSKGVSKDRQGAALGINSSFQALSQAIAPLFAGITSGIIHVSASFLVGAISILVSFYIIRTHTANQ